MPAIFGTCLRCYVLVEAGIKVCAGGVLIVRYIGVDPDGSNSEDLFTLEAEISELQRENARVESQMLRLKTDITAMEAHLRHGDKVKLN